MTQIAQMGALLLQGATTATDATAGRAAGAGSSWYVIFTEVTTALSALVFLVLMLILIPALIKFRKTAEKLEGVLDHIERSIDPVTKHASHIADNVDYISTSVRADVQEIRKTLLSANAGIREVIDASERRLHELGAVLRVVQEEAEHAFVSAASTVRGLRAGAATLRENGALPSATDDLQNEELAEFDGGDFEDDSLETDDALDIVDEFDDENDVNDEIETINDLDAARNAAGDMRNGHDNGTTLGRSEPRIKRTRRSERG